MKGARRGHTALAVMLALMGTAACSSPRSLGHASTPSPRYTYQGLVTTAPSRHITYPEELPPGGCSVEGMSPDQYPIWLCVPGVITSGVNESNYPKTGCDPHYERRIRPPAPEIAKAMGQIRKEFRLNPGARWRLDWLIPLSLGGANDLRNLWPAPTPETAARKKEVDKDVLAAVCAGTVSLTAAQSAMAGSWINAELSLGIQ